MQIDIFKNWPNRWLCAFKDLRTCTFFSMVSIATTMDFRNYWHNYVKRCCSGSKTLRKDHMVRLKIISLYIYKDLRLMVKIVKMS